LLKSRGALPLALAITKHKLLLALEYFLSQNRYNAL